jgi:hypothetical protein
VSAVSLIGEIGEPTLLPAISRSRRRCVTVGSSIEIVPDHFSVVTDPGRTVRALA